MVRRWHSRLPYVQRMSALELGLRPEFMEPLPQDPLDASGRRLPVEVWLFARARQLVRVRPLMCAFLSFACALLRLRGALLRLKGLALSGYSWSLAASCTRV
jgi:hypothetical protein